MLLNIPNTVLCCAYPLSHVQLFVTPWTRLLCLWEFSRQEYWRRLPCPPPGDLSDPGIKPKSPTLQWILYHLSQQWSPFLILMYIILIVTLIAILIYNFNLINILILILKFSSYFCIFYIFLLQTAFVCSTFSSTFLELGIWRAYCLCCFLYTPYTSVRFFKWTVHLILMELFSFTISLLVLLSF